MIKLLSLTLSLLLLLGALFTSCKQNELPSDLTHNSSETNTLTNIINLDEYVVPTEYTQPYMTTGHGGYKRYKNNFYYCNIYCYIEYIQLDEENTDFRMLESLKENVKYPKLRSICTDPICEHKHSYDNCIADTSQISSEFVIDEVESAGGNPVFYYFAYDDSTNSDSEIYRIDSAAGTKERLAAVKDPINKMAIFKDGIYFITQSSDDSYKINMIKKTGGDVVTLSAGEGRLRMLGGNQTALYLNDKKGDVYAVDYEMKSAEVVYSITEFYPSSDGYLGAFINGDYLYFFADFEMQTFPWDGDTIDFVKHSIRRIRLDTFEGEGEIVADDVFEDAVYGIYQGILYYGPYAPKTDLDYKNDPAYVDYYTHSNGTIRCVDLNTLEKQDVVSDCGLNIEYKIFAITDKYIVSIVHPYRSDFGLSPYTSGSMIFLYVFESGALYRLCGYVG